jgi:hypothetical protein
MCEFGDRPTFLGKMVEKSRKKSYIKRGDGGNAVVPYL